METVLKAIADWIKGILTAGIMSNLSGLFDDVNTQFEQHGPAAGQQKPRCNNDDRCLRQKQREAAPGQRAKRNSAASGQMPVRCAVPSFTYGVCR